jgi:hypothetical protein
MNAAEWENRLADAWARLDELDEADFLALIDKLASELPEGSAVAAFERACSFDSTGHSDRAVPLYREALDTGLTGERRRRAVIQMASSIRNLGRPQERRRPAHRRAGRWFRPPGRRGQSRPGAGPHRRRPGARGGVAGDLRAGAASTALPTLHGQLRPTLGRT